VRKSPRRECWRQAGLWAFVIMAVLWAASASTAKAAVAKPYQVRDYDHGGTNCATIQGTNYKTPASVTGMAFDGTDLLFSCWGDDTITAIRPVASQTVFAKDQAAGGSLVGEPGIYRVTDTLGNPLDGIGALDWDADHQVLWACNLTGASVKKVAADLGYITLTNDGSGTAVFTHFADVPESGCVNGVDYNPYASNPFTFGNPVVSTAGVPTNLPKTASTKTVDQYGIVDNAGVLVPAGTSPTTWPPLGSLTGNGYVSGIENTPAIAGTVSGLFLADNQGSTKTLHYTADGATSIQITSSTSHRFEDLACDSQTFAPQTVIWVEWFDHNQAQPFKIDGTC
jgi:hypothetical protein